MRKETGAKRPLRVEGEKKASGEGLRFAAAKVSQPMSTASGGAPEHTGSNAERIGDAIRKGVRRILRRSGEEGRSGGKEPGGKRSLRMEEEKKTFGEGLNFAAAEAYRLLRTNVLFALPFSSLTKGQTCRVIGVTSSLSGEGKSTTALNLAYVLARSGRKILLVEADMRLPTISKRLNLEKKEGLSNLLVGLCKEEEVLQPSGLQEQLWVMASGETPPNPSELLGSGRMRDAVDNLGADFDFIILDLPPVSEVSDALVVSRLTQGMIMVVRQGYATRSSVAAAMRQLDYVDAKVLGFVMTCADGQGGKYGKYKSYYKSKYSYAKAGRIQEEAQ